MQIDIVVNRQTDFRIYLYPAAGKVGEFARDELRKYVNLISGATLPDAGQPADHTIILGLRSEMVSVPECKQGFDGYTIVTTRSEITICGENPRGLLYGVYDLLEKWGCRFYVPLLDDRDPEVIPQSPHIQATIESRSEASPMEFRIINAGSFFFDMEENKVVKQIDWVAKNRYNGISWQPSHHKGRLESDMQNLKKWGAIDMLEERGLFLHGPGHCFAHFLHPDDYFAEHPEYFGQFNGARTENLIVNFCWSNKEAVKICQDHIIEFMQKWPIFKVLYLVANDGGYVCQCAECQKIGGSNLLIDFFNTLSLRMDDELPGVWLESVLGYGPMMEVPDKIKPNGKWGGLHAHWGRDHTKAYGDSDYSNVADLYVWVKLFGERLSICSYYTNISHQPYLGVPYLYALEADMDFMVENRVKGSFILNFPLGTWWGVAYNNFMGGRIAYYYPNLKPEDALKEYSYTYFGEKAGETLFQLRKWMSDNLARISKVTFGNGNEQDVTWLKHLQKMNELALYLNDGQQPYAYRIEKNIMLFKHQIMWADSEQRVKRCKQAVEKLESGEISKEEAAKRIAAEKEAIDRLADFTFAIDKSHPGLVEAEWFRNGVMNRIFYDPVAKFEAKLETK